MEEIWKDIKGYEGYYQISNKGKVKSLARKVKAPHGVYRKTNERILKPGLMKGYHNVGLRKHGKSTTLSVHKLVWDHFGDGRKGNSVFHVDHKDGDKSNNSIDNLRLLPINKNISQSYRRKGRTLPAGVYEIRKNKYLAAIQINRKSFNLGIFDDVKTAASTYQTALSYVIHQYEQGVPIDKIKLHRK